LALFSVQLDGDWVHDRDLVMLIKSRADMASAEMDCCARRRQILNGRISIAVDFWQKAKQNLNIRW
jgi:hypothetical protein